MSIYFFPRIFAWSSCFYLLLHHSSRTVTQLTLIPCSTCGAWGGSRSLPCCAMHEHQRSRSFHIVLRHSSRYASNLSVDGASVHLLSHLLCSTSFSITTLRVSVELHRSYRSYFLQLFSTSCGGFAAHACRSWCLVQE